MIKGIHFDHGVERTCKGPYYVCRHQISAQHSLSLSNGSSWLAVCPLRITCSALPWISIKKGFTILKFQKHTVQFKSTG
jgi:hypothetical protein